MVVNVGLRGPRKPTDEDVSNVRGASILTARCSRGQRLLRVGGHERSRGRVDSRTRSRREYHRIVRCALDAHPAAESFRPGRRALRILARLLGLVCCATRRAVRQAGFLTGACWPCSQSPRYSGTRRLVRAISAPPSSRSTVSAVSWSCSVGAVTWASRARPGASGSASAARFRESSTRRQTCCLLHRQDDPDSHQLCSRGHARSRSEMIRSPAGGHSIASAGSSQRTPRAAAGSYSRDIW
jgi:hypothetical protein